MHCRQITMHFNHPLFLGNQKILKKEITLIADQKHNCLAELSYIEGLHPPFSTSTLASQIEKILGSNFFEQTLQIKSLEESFTFFNENRPHLHPSMLFIFEQFLVSHYFYKHREKIQLPLNFSGQLLLDQNISLTLNEQFILWASLLSENPHITRVKMKVGKRPSHLEKELFVMIIEHFPYVRFRLDFNERGEEEAMSYLPFLKQHRFYIDYLESPPAALKTYFPLGLDLAMDFTSAQLKLTENNFGHILNTNVCSLILKPSILGLAYSLQLAKNALQRKISISFSSCYESPLAHFLMAFALNDYLPIEPDQEYAIVIAYGTWNYIKNKDEIEQALQELRLFAHWPKFSFKDSIVLY